jgi:hypothetical protein
MLYKKDVAEGLMVLMRYGIPLREPPYLFLSRFVLDDIKEWCKRGEHPYWYGVWYVYRPGPFICS